MKRLFAFVLFWPVVSFGQTPPPAMSAEATLIPTKIHQCIMQYPPRAFRSGSSGSATLLYRVTADGRVVGVIVAASTGNADLDAASVECAKAWKYQPTKLDGPTGIAASASVQWVFVRGPHKISLVLRKPYNTCMSDPDLGTLKAEVHSGITAISYALKDGEIVAASVEKSSGNDLLDRRALTCVKSWHFEPQTNAAYIVVTVLSPAFQLKPSPYDDPESPESLTSYRATAQRTAIFDWDEITTD